jgi:hypothetical protein
MITKKYRRLLIGLSFIICHLSFSVALTACTPDSDSMGAIDLTTAQLAENSGFSVNVDQNTNQVTFTSLLPSSYSVYWEYGPNPNSDDVSISGTSTNNIYQVGVAFDGDYYVRMGVQTRGGIVFSDRASFHIDAMNPNLISDPAWTMLTGGVGHAKEWVLDLDANGTCLKFGGPKWFYTSGMSWDSFHNIAGENYLDSEQWDSSTAIDPTYASEWYWTADWAGNGWICGAADYGTMTFDLINGANVDVNGQKGSFNMDVASHTISFTGVLPLSPGQDDAILGQRPDGNYKIIYLTENAMQIMFDGGSNDNTPFTFNYISKEFKDSYVAPVITTITLPENWMSYVQPFNQNTTTYKFDEDAPFCWFTLAGEEISRSGFDGDPDIADAEFELNSKTKTFKITDIAGNVTEGTYDISEDGVLSFSQLPTFGISTNKNIKFESSTNELQVITYELSDRTGDLTDLWLGSKQYDDQGNAYEYLAYHFKKQTGGAQVESFTGKLSYSDTGWAFLESSEVYITGEGDYTFTLTPNGSTNTQDPYLMFLDVAKILKKHPNTDMILKSIKVDGAEMLGSEEGMDDATISRGIGDDPTTGRRYILNPWNEESATHTNLFKFSNSIEVTITVKFDVGEVVLK